MDEKPLFYRFAANNGTAHTFIEDDLIMVLYRILPPKVIGDLLDKASNGDECKFSSPKGDKLSIQLINDNTQ